MLMKDQVMRSVVHRANLGESIFQERIFNVLAILILIGTLSGCATQSRIAPGSNNLVHVPNVGDEAEAEIGQTIVKKIYVTTHPAIQIDNDFISVKSDIGNRYTVRIKAGILAAHSKDGSGIYYAPDSGTYSLKNFLTDDKETPCANPSNVLLCGIYIPNEPNKAPIVWSILHRQEVPGLNFRRTTKEAWTENSFKKELIYGGLSQKTISISYREFSDGTARPAFTQDIKYDLSEGDIIGFRGARFKVIKATNTTLRYKLLKPLE